MNTAAPGWYDDGSGRQRWWTGVDWSDHYQDQAPVQPTIQTTRRDARAAEAQSHYVQPQTVAASTSARPIDKLSKNDARSLAAALQAECARLEAIVTKHGLQPLADADEYVASAERQVAELRSSVASEMDAARQAAAAEFDAQRQQAAAELQAQRIAADQQIALTNSHLATLDGQRRQLESEVAFLNSQRVDLSATVELQSVGLFDFEHPAQSSATLATELEAVRSEIKSRISRKTAAQWSNSFSYNGSLKDGQKFTENLGKGLLRGYNAEAENAIKTTRAGNLHVAQARLTKAAEQVEKAGSMASIRIDPGFHRLRLREIELANRHLMTVQHERELERERKAELREQQRAEQELRKEHDRLEKERSHYQATLAALEANGDSEGAERMRAKILDVQHAIDDVDYRTANIRAGYVYVISNFGAFGERMVKIGMTRRLEPMDRVNELGDASVPFRFDVHALFFADDAVGVEAMLHTTFAAQRVNKVNLRREFFYATPDEVLNALKTHSVEVVEFAVHAKAEEFRASSGQAELV